MGQLYWENVKEGEQLPALRKIATTLNTIAWAGAAGDIAPLHYDDPFAVAAGFQRSIVHGALKRQWMIQLIIDWIGEEGFLKKLSCQFRAVDYPRRMKTMVEPQEGETWFCKGLVKKTYVESSECLVDCDIWVENSKGEKTTLGKATVSLPKRL